MIGFGAVSDAKPLDVAELAISDAEGKRLARPMADLCEQHNFVPPPHIKSLAELVVASALIFGPRIGSIIVRRRAERANPVNPANNGRAATLFSTEQPPFHQTN